MSGQLHHAGLLVLGMHRSGTSAVTGVLHHLGAALGDRLIPADPGVNPKGYWEHAVINQCHETLLRRLGSAWYDALPLTPGWQDDDAVGPQVQALAAAIDASFGQLPFWAVKDPRLCRMLPLWKSLLERRGWDAKCLLMLRHPMEVAQSLATRDGIERHHALLLWMRYVLDSEQASRGLPRAVLTYEQLLADWRSAMQRLNEALGLGMDWQDPQVTAQVEDFLDAHLRHHQAGSERRPEDVAENLATRIYLAACRADSASLDALRCEFDALVLAHTPWLNQVNRLMQTVQEQRAGLEQAEAAQVAAMNKIASLEHEVARVKASLSWQVTKPLRGVQGLFRRVQPK